MSKIFSLFNEFLILSDILLLDELKFPLTFHFTNLGKHFTAFQDSSPWCLALGCYSSPPSAACRGINKQPVPCTQSTGSLKPIKRNRETTRKAAANPQALQSVKSLLRQSSLRFRWLNTTHSDVLDNLILARANKKHGFLSSAFLSLQLFCFFISQLN